MTVTETAKRIGISPSKLYQMVGSRQIAYHRIGKKIVFSEDDIAAFLSSCRVSATPAESILQLPRLKLKHLKLGRGS